MMLLLLLLLGSSTFDLIENFVVEVHLNFNVNLNSCSYCCTLLVSFCLGVVLMMLSGVVIEEKTNYSYHNRGILTV